MLQVMGWFKVILLCGFIKLQVEPPLGCTDDVHFSYSDRSVLRVQLRVRRSQSIVFSCWHQGSGNIEIPTCTCAAGASTAATAGAAALMRSIVHVDPIDCC